MHASGLFLLALAATLQGRPETPSYRLPYEAGKTYRITQGNNSGGTHRGNGRHAFDFGMPVGTPVCAARGGKVVVADEDEKNAGSGGKHGPLGNNIRIDHGDGTFGRYFHLQYQGALVEAGDVVLQGDAIGLSGATGNVTGPHLHFQVDKGGRSIEITFDDVEKDGGIPKAGKSYASRNFPGIPAVVKNRLTMLWRGAKLAEQEGAYGVAYRAYKRFADEKLKVKYPPQDEARRKVDEILERAGAAARETDPLTLLRAEAAFDGVPTKAIKKAVRGAKKQRSYSDAKRAAWHWELYFAGLKFEVEGRLPSARSRYKKILSNRADPALMDRARKRLDVVEARLLEILRRPLPISASWVSSPSP